MTAYDIAFATLIRYHLVTVNDLCDGVLKAYARKSGEKALADLVRAGLAVGHEFDGRTKVYGLTPRAARLHGLSARRFAKRPSMQAIVQSLTVLRLCTCGPVHRKRLTPREFAAAFPEQAAAKGVCKTLYYIDRREAQPRLAVIVPDFGAAYFRVAKKALRAVTIRKRHKPFCDYIYPGLFLVTVATGFPSKAERIRECLAGMNFPYPVEVEVVPGIADLLMRGDGDE